MANGTPDKVFTIVLNFELGQHKTSRSRLRAAYDEAVQSAVEAVEAELLPGSIVEAKSTMAYDYRFMARTESLTQYVEQANADGGSEERKSNGTSWTEDDDDYDVRP